MTNEELVRAALEKVGGKSNVLTATNCMTRLRVRVKDDAKIDDEGLKAIEGVMGIVHDRTGYVEIVVGPGKCRKCADICRDMGIPADAAASTANDWQTNKAAVKAGQKQSKVKELFKTFGDSTRMRILFVLLESEACVCGLASVLNMTDSAISHQLRILKNNRLVKSRREGKSVYYSLADDHVRTIVSQGMDHVEE